LFDTRITDAEANRKQIDITEVMQGC